MNLSFFCETAISPEPLSVPAVMTRMVSPSSVRDKVGDAPLLSLQARGTFVSAIFQYGKDERDERDKIENGTRGV